MKIKIERIEIHWNERVKSGTVKMEYIDQYTNKEIER